MANIFALVLIITTFITGLLWCLEKFLIAKNYHIYDDIIVNNVIQEQQGKHINNMFRLILIRWLRIGASIFPILATVLIIRSFLYEPFQIPSSSMMPTLLINDFILVNKFTYGIKDPIYQNTLIRIGYPRRGDIVVFKYPKYPHMDYIKRVIGLPGDKVIYDPILKEIAIYPKCDNNNCKNILPITYSDVKPNNFINILTNLNEKILIDNFLKLNDLKIKINNISFIERKETIGNITHGILITPNVQDQLEMYYQQPEQYLATWIVPSKQYFVMGDNRDNSLDSRYWGFVPEINLVGKAIAIWMSFGRQDGLLPISIRWNRIGKIH